MADNPHSDSMVQPLSSPSSSSSSTPSRSSLSESRSPPSRNPSLRLAHMPLSNAPHRQSFSESLRGLPPSPRAQRQPSLTQLAIQELIDNPPPRNHPDPAFVGRDWRSVSVVELLSPEELRFVDVDTEVEAATNLLIESGANVLLTRDNPNSHVAIGTFGYNDLNAYLLTVIGVARADEDHIQDFREVAKKAKKGLTIPIRDVTNLAQKEPLTLLPHTANLLKAVETFGTGIHRILVVREGTKDVVGVLSQTKLVRFLWENGRSFPVIDQLYPQYLRDIKIGSNQVISINGDKPLIDALTLLMDEGVSSLAILDNGHNVIGNISTVDVKLLTKSSSFPLLRNTCIHFISVILSARGMSEGKDSFPVFHVTPMNTLAHTVAKLVATRSHRMWVTDPISPSSSGPPTPSSHPATLVPTSSHSSSISSASGQPHIIPPSPSNVTSPHQTPSNPTPFVNPTGPSISASALPGARISGHLVGVVSLTDILILFAKASGLPVADPGELRVGRRRSSSSSVRQSVDLGVRPKLSGDLSREGSAIK